MITQSSHQIIETVHENVYIYSSIIDNQFIIVYLRIENNDSIEDGKRSKS